MEYRNQIGIGFETHIANQLDRVLDRQRETHARLGEVQRAVERVDMRTSMQATPTPQRKVKEPWNIQLMMYLFIIALGIGGHITFADVAAMLTK